METSTNRNSEFAFRLLNRLHERGVRHIVLSPGSRSQALALAAAALERQSKVQLHVRIDERSTAFTALGIAVETGIPAAVIVTSGTAVANLLPAVVEAHHAGVPMLLLTADRPEEMRGIGSSQTTIQYGMFGEFVRSAVQVPPPEDAAGHPEFAAEALADQAYSSALGDEYGPGPVQLNLAFRNPLSGPVSAELLNSGNAVAVVTNVTEAAGFQPFRPSLPELVIIPEVGTVVVAGHGAGPDAAAVAEQLGSPLFAEVTSGSRFGPNLVVNYRALLNTPEFLESITRVIVYGLPTLSREIPALLQRDVETVIVQGRHAEQYNPGNRNPLMASAITVEGGTEHPNWQPCQDALRGWLRADRMLLQQQDDSLPAPNLTLAQDPHYLSQAKFAAQELEITRTPVTRQSLVEAIWYATWPHDRLVIGASMLIRVMDTHVRGRKISAHANRGVAGIDGVLSTALGIAAARKADEPGTTRLLLGDLSFLHDIGALFLNPAEPKPRILVIVGNDHGGSLFDKLEVAQSAPPDDFDRVIYLPQQVDLASIVTGYGWKYLHASTRGECDRILASPVLEPTVLEVALER